MLIKCLECGHDVSSTAEKCMNCGAAIGSPNEFPLNDNKNVQMIERTSKHFKEQRIWSWVLFIVGVLISGKAFNGGRGLSDSSTFGLMLVGISIVWGICISLAVWWHHG